MKSYFQKSETAHHKTKEKKASSFIVRNKLADPLRTTEVQKKV